MTGIKGVSPAPGKYLYRSFENKNVLDPRMAKRLTIQVLLALDYLHSQNLAFLCLNPENVLIDGNYNAKLCHFLSVRPFKDGQMLCNAANTFISYSPMELAFAKTCDPRKVDTYMAGMTYTMFLSGLFPVLEKDWSAFRSRNQPNTITLPEKIKREGKELSQEETDVLWSRAKTVISKMLSENPTERALPRECLRDPAFRP